MILEEILSEIGRNNHLGDFLSKLHFDEANTRLVNYNKASKQKEDKVSVTPDLKDPSTPSVSTGPSPSAGKARTDPAQRHAGRLHEPGRHAGTHAPAGRLVL